MHKSLIVFVVSNILFTAHCKKEEKKAPIAETPPPPAASQKPVQLGAKRFSIQSAGKVQIVIDAPNEKFMGETSKLGGVFDVNFDQIKASKGEVSTDLDTIKTSTFKDADENETQTEHAKNWFEIGEKVEKEKREDYRIARFIIESIDESSAASLKDASPKEGIRTITVKASGNVRVHGRNAKRSVRVELQFVGSTDSPSEVRFRLLDPLAVSLAEHDVKPRDLAGKFIKGALEVVRSKKKIDDNAKIHIEGFAQHQPSQAPVASNSNAKTGEVGK